MRLTKKALSKINDQRRKQRMLSLLSLALGTSEMSVRRYLKSNSEELTKASALEVIRREIGLSDDEILEVATAKAA